MKRGIILGLFVLLAFCTHGQAGGRGLVGGVPARVLRAAPCSSRHAVSGGVRLELTGIYIDSALLWFVFRGVNRSAIDFRAGGMRFLVRDRHAMKRRALQELRLVPLVRREVAVIRADSAVQLCYGLTPRVPGRAQELVIEWVEKNGDRRMQLRVPASALLRARRL